MDIINEYADFLQNIEFAIVKSAADHPSLTDKDILLALDRLGKFYQRKKKKMPELESTLKGGALDVFQDVKTIIETRRKKGPGEEPAENEIGDVPINVVIAGISKLQKSASFWNKKNGAKGYLNYIANFIQ